jgi:hypothetical protein
VGGWAERDEVRNRGVVTAKIAPGMPQRPVQNMRETKTVTGGISRALPRRPGSRMLPVTN